MSTALKAPIAFLDEGFSSDGAFVSGAETDAGTPIIEEATDMEGPATPVANEEIKENPTPAHIAQSPWGKQGVPDEKWESAGLIDYGEDSPEEGPMLGSAPVSAPGAGSNRYEPYHDKMAMRAEFEAQALSRPRPTTPVRSCAIESFVESAAPAVAPDDNSMKINLPSSILPSPTVKTPKLHRRQSSQSWSEFAESMSQSREPDDMFESPHVPRDKVPPSPVVHRRSSQDWVSFEDSQEPQVVPDTFSSPLPKLEDYLAGQDTFSDPFDSSPQHVQNTNGAMEDQILTEQVSQKCDVSNIRGFDGSYTTDPSVSYSNTGDPDSAAESPNEYRVSSTDAYYASDPYSQRVDHTLYNEVESASARTLKHSNNNHNDSFYPDVPDGSRSEIYSDPEPKKSDENIVPTKHQDFTLPSKRNPETNVFVPQTPTITIDQHFLDNPELRYSSSESGSQIDVSGAHPAPEPEKDADEIASTDAEAPQLPEEIPATGSTWTQFDDDQPLSFQHEDDTMNDFAEQTYGVTQEQTGFFDSSRTEKAEADVVKHPPRPNFESWNDQLESDFVAEPGDMESDFAQDHNYPVLEDQDISIPDAQDHIHSNFESEDIPTFTSEHEFLSEETAGTWTTFEDEQPSFFAPMPTEQKQSKDDQMQGSEVTAGSATTKAPPPRPAPPPPRPATGPQSTEPNPASQIKPLSSAIKISLPSLPGPKKSETKSQEMQGSEGSDQPRKQGTVDDESSSDDEPYVPPSASPPRMAGDLGPVEKGPSEEWKAFLQMTDRVSDIMKQSQAKLLAMKENTTIKDLRKVPKYMNMQTGDGEKVDEDIMDIAAKTPDPDKEWKDVTQVLNEDIRKKKEASKPSRPPPPAAKVKPKPTRNPSVVSYDPLNPTWDDDTVQEYYKAASYADRKQSNAVSEDIAEFENENDELQTRKDGAKEHDVESERTKKAAEDEINGNVEDSEVPTWAPLEEAKLPSSHSDFFAQARQSESETHDPFSMEEDKTDYDPFEVKPVDEIVEEAKRLAQKQAAESETKDDLEMFGALAGGTRESSATGSPDKPDGFEDSFVKAKLDGDEDDEDDLPLYDEDDSQPLEEFPPKFTGDGWDLMIRFPLKKKFIGDRYWKPIYVTFRQQHNVLTLFHSKTDQRPFQETQILPTYSLSSLELQPYDIYSKIHTVKLQHVIYQERVGVRPGQIPKMVQGRFTKLGMPLEHAAVSTQIVKLGCLQYEEMLSFVRCIEDALFQVTSHSAHLSGVNLGVQYKQDEVQVHVYDEYECSVDKDGIVSNQLARVRIFCLAFLTGPASVELGLNDRRRQGKEVVRRKDIMPLYTDRWIRFECLEFHSVVDKTAFDGSDHVISFRPMDACFFELMRFRVRPPKNKELPLKIRSTMRICGSKIEIRMEALVTGFRSQKAHQIPCEDIQIRFPIPEAWIYLFREERHWGVGSIHGRVRRPGKVKNIKDKLMGMVQHIDNCLIEIATGEAKYEHVYRALVWRIPRLPEKHHGAYKNHLLRCRFELSSFDLMPETFIPSCEVEFTMPMCTVSSAVVRSVSINQHEDPDEVEKFVRYVAKYQYKVSSLHLMPETFIPSCEVEFTMPMCTVSTAVVRSVSINQHEDPDEVEKFVRYVAKYQYKVEIDYVQVSELDVDAVLDPKVLDPESSMEHTPAQHQPSIDVDAVKDAHGGYKIEFDEAELGRRPSEQKGSSSSDDDDAADKPLKVNIDMSKYAY